MPAEHDSGATGGQGAGCTTPNQRSHRRLLCSDLVSVCWIGARGFPREEIAVLEDYSRIGAGLFLTVRIDPGVSINLRTEWETFGATVVHCSWRENGYLLGVAFNQPRTDTEIYVPEHLLDLADLEL